MAGYVFSPAERWGVIWNLHRKALIVDNNQMSNRCITWPRSRIFWIIKDRQISPVISYMTRRPLLNNWVLLQTYLGPNCLSVSDHFVGLALKGLTIFAKSTILDIWQDFVCTPILGPSHFFVLDIKISFVIWLVT